MKFSRYLYAVDEIIWTFIDCLLNKRSLDECLFWIFEYYYSGYKKKTWNLLWRTYYDFYAIKYPKCERMIQKQNNLNTIKSIIYVVKNLFPLNPSPTIFKLRKFKLISPSHIYHGKIPNWASHDHNLLLAIHKKHFHNAVFHMQKYNNHIDQLYSIICNYFQTIHNISFKNKKLNDISYKNKLHIIIVIIVYLSNDEADIVKKSEFLQVNDDEVKQITLFNNQTIQPLYKTLHAKRLFSISSNIGCFQLKRFKGNCPNINIALWYHWEYFAYLTPLWKERFNVYNVTVDHKRFIVHFNNDDDYEEFHEQFNYEPDEQSKETQCKSIIDIPICNFNDWLFQTFGEN